MEFENKIRNSYKKGDSDSEINFIEIIEKLKNNWKSILFFVLFGFLLSFVYLRYTENQYRVSTTIFIDDKNSGGLASELSAFEDLGVFSKGSNKSVINEIGVLKSHTLMENVIKDLSINISYYTEGKIAMSEVYGSEVPFKVNFFIKDSILFNLDQEFKFIAQSTTRYILRIGDNDTVINCVFGKNVKTEFGEINIVPLNSEDINFDETIVVKMAPVHIVANYYVEKLKIATESDLSSLLILTLTDAVKQKAQDILNNLVLQYINDEIAYKTFVSENTDKFINDRIIDISLDLTNVDRGVEEFKVKNKLTNIEAESNLILETNSELEKKIVDLNSQIQLINFVIEYITNNKDQLIPANLIIDDSSSNTNISMYNTLLLERNRILKGSSNLNPTIITLEEQLEKLRQSIEQSLSSLRSSFLFSLKKAKDQEYLLGVRRYNAPQQEREFQDIKRKQQIIESLYLYLLKKREENAISLGIPVPNAKIIDRADGSDLPISPIPKLVYSMSGFLALILTITIILIKSLLDNKVHTSEDVESVVDAPFIGNIPKAKLKEKVIITDRSRDRVSEAYRLLRTNVNFMLNNIKEDSKTIFVTSTIGSEGKTFVSINLSLSMGLLDKKILLIEADIRKPTISSSLKLKRNKGLTHYLIDENLVVSDIIINYNENGNNIDIISSGEIPPNPSELLLNGRFENILSYGKDHYDYILIDTPPVNIVTDTLLLAPYAQLFIYVIRAEYLDKKLLKVPQMMYRNNRLPNMAMLINAVEMENESYDYGYMDSKKSWWNKILSPG